MFVIILFYVIANEPECIANYTVMHDLVQLLYNFNKHSLKMSIID